MPRLSKNAFDQEDNVTKHAEETMKDIAMHATSPIFICGVNRKANVGNFETIDVYAGVSLPLVGVLPEDIETLKKAVQDASELGFGMVSEETWKRYSAIKELQKGGRPGK